MTSQFFPPIKMITSSKIIAFKIPHKLSPLPSALPLMLYFFKNFTIKNVFSYI
jgi:hypothetical protein